MIVTVRQSDQPPSHYRALWAWCAQNGFVAMDVADAILVDTERQIITIWQWMPVHQPGNPDFPELHRDKSDHPLSEERELPLAAPVPRWMNTRDEANRLLDEGQPTQAPQATDA